jgi:hypothetical protein
MAKPRSGSFVPGADGLNNLMARKLSITRQGCNENQAQNVQDYFKECLKAEQSY